MCLNDRRIDRTMNAPNLPTPPDDPKLPGMEDPTPALTGDEFLESHGESLSKTLDLDTWTPGADLLAMYQRLASEVQNAVREEHDYIATIRRDIFPKLRSRPGAPPTAGVYQASVEDLERVHTQLLFNGGVSACDGTVVSHDTLPITITQIGICLVSYHGNQGSWVHQMFRRDLRTKGKNPIDETLDLLDRRRNRGAVGQSESKDGLTSMARRGIMAYAERKVLLDRCESIWRMGHGSPTPYELVTGSGMPDLVRNSLDLMSRLVLDHQRFVFIPSSTGARDLLTIGNALRPLEYAIVDDNTAHLRKTGDGNYRGAEWGPLGKQVDAFVEECGPKIVVGMYRASEFSPVQMFYAHADRVHEAALIAMADSVLQEHRGFPMLIDLADGLCTANFGGDVFAASTRMAYTESGEPYRYMSERSTRK